MSAIVETAAGQQLLGSSRFGVTWSGRFALSQRYTKRLGIASHSCSAGSGRGDLLPCPEIRAAGSTLVESENELAAAERLAETISYAEAMERLAGGIPRGALVREDTWKGSSRLRKLSVDSIPRCSASERSDSRCRVSDPHEDDRIRWLEAWELHSGEPTLVPLTMAAYRFQRWPTERFWNGISTGHAVHTDAVQAILSGLLEVVERDATMVAWLQRLALPRLDLAQFDGRLGRLIRDVQRRFLRVDVLDATLDLMIPCMIAIVTAPFDRWIATSVGSSCNTDPSRAAEKAVIEAVQGRRYQLSRREEDGEPDFQDISDSSRVMARPANSSAFDFWLERPPVAGLPQALTDPTATSDEQLLAVLGRLRAEGMPAYVVSKTRSELVRAGLTAVCCIVPRLMPLSLHPYTQYRATPRLYELPSKLGLSPAAEADLNSDLLPFA